MNTCVLCISRLKLFEWMMRSRSRWNAMRTGESASTVLRVAALLRVARGDRCWSSDRSSMSRIDMGFNFGGVSMGVTILVALDDLEFRKAGHKTLLAVPLKLDGHLLVVVELDHFSNQPGAELRMEYLLRHLEVG